MIDWTAFHLQVNTLEHTLPTIFWYTVVNDTWSLCVCVCVCVCACVWANLYEAIGSTAGDGGQHLQSDFFHYVISEEYIALQSIT